MLQGFRKHKRWMMALIIGPISIAFVATGIYSYSRSDSADTALAEVAGTKITPEQFDQAKREQLQALRNQMGDQFKSNILDNQEARAALLDRLMSERALAAEVVKEGILVSKDQAVQMIKGSQLFKTNGQFDPELYKRFLASQGKSDEGFVQEIQQSLARDILVNTVNGTATVSKTTAEQLNRLIRERREVRILTIPSQKFLADAKVSDEDAKKYYDANKSEFLEPEHEKVQYVVLTPDQFQTAQPTEDEVKTYYQQNGKKFAAPEERQARHILIGFGSDEKAAKKKAEDLEAQLRAHPEQFADIAKKESIDKGSAVNGGDLGWFGRGAMVPEFDAAVFAAKKGDIVGPVRTQYGFHIIQVTDARGGAVPPLDQVRSRIIAEYGKQMAAKKFAEAADDFSNLVVDQGGSLQPVIDKYHLKPVEVENVTKNGLGNTPDAKYLNEHVIELLFAADSVNGKRNTQAIEVAPNILVSARALEHHPAAELPFEKVKDSIINKLKAESAMAAAKAEGEKKLAELRANPSDAGFSQPAWVSREQPMGQPLELVSNELRVPASKLPAYVGTSLNGVYVISHVTSSEVPKITDDEMKAAKAQLAKLQGGAEASSYLGALKVSLKSKVKKADYEYPKAGDGKASKPAK
ncbi:MAG: SurA N-terminal domain-containing protein [Mesosutterella sp.]|nr:SurA N-terminal domain-containing protein [Mesosutterella sp.]